MLLQAVSGSAKPSPLLGATATGFGPLSSTRSSAGIISSKSLNLLSPSTGSVSRLVLPRKSNKGFVISASGKALSGFLFQPFEEVKRKEFLVPTPPSVSLARQKYANECEAAINEQINVEYNVSYVYHALYAYFDRDNVALKGFAKFFKESSEEERERAEKLMKYQNTRGGRVKLHSIVASPSEFVHAEKGDALHAMELALSLEKLTNRKLLSLQSVAARNNDVEMQAFIDREFLGEQVEAINKIAEYVTQLRMIGEGHGVWHFDQKLLHQG